VQQCVEKNIRCKASGKKFQVFHVYILGRLVNEMLISHKIYHFIAVVLCLALHAFTSSPAVTVKDKRAKIPARQSEKQVLRFVSPVDQLLDELFLELHPDVSFEYVGWDPGYEQYMDTNLFLAINKGDPTAPIADIYLVNANEDLPHLVRDGYLLDLSDSESIVTSHETYFPQAQRALSNDGKPVAVPVSFCMGGLAYNKKAWDDLGLPNIPKTATELVQLLSRWNQDIVLHPENILYGTGLFYDVRLELLLDVINVYIIQNTPNNAMLSFDTPEFKNIVSRIVDLPQLPYNPVYVKSPAPLIYLESFSLLSINTGIISNDAGIKFEPVLPMGFSEDKPAKVGAKMDVICIERNTQNRELAIEYVEFILKHQTNLQEDLHAMLTLDVQEMYAMGVQKEIQDIYCSLVPSIAIGNGAIDGYWTIWHDEEYFENIFLDAYNLLDQTYSSQTIDDKLITLIKNDISPLIARLNEENQYLFYQSY
jgi:maltose-binding protein MalE